MSDTMATKAFTTKSTSISTQLKNISKVIYNNNSMDVVTLWDTGASLSCISESVVKQLSLLPTGKIPIKTPSGGTDVYTYLVDITLPNDVELEDIMVCETAIGEQGIDLLVGMDIMSQGDFAVSNYNGMTYFTFRYPSQKNADFVLEMKINKLIGEKHGKGKRKKK